MLPSDSRTASFAGLAALTGALFSNTLASAEEPPEAAEDTNQALASADSPSAVPDPDPNWHAGFRYLYINYRPTNFVFDTAMNGPIAGLTYNFK